MIALVVTAVAPLVEMLLLATRKARARTDVASGELVLEYGRGLKGLTVFGAGFFLFIVTVLTTAFQASGVGLLIVIVLFYLALGLPVSILGIEVFLAHYGINASGIRKGSPWTRKFFALWTDVGSVSYDPTLKRFVIQTSQGTIHLHEYLNGLADFAAATKAHVPRETWSAAASRIEMLSSPPIASERGGT